MKKHFVTFSSPGTFVHEQTTKPIDSWDTAKAVEMARGIKERHAAVPFCFHFSTRERGPDDLDSKQVKESGRYYLGGEIQTLEEVEARNLPDESILRSNMKANGWGKIIVNFNSWKVTQPLLDGDQVLEFTA